MLWVRCYLSFKLSSRDLVQIMNERSIVSAQTTFFLTSHEAATGPTDITLTNIARHRLGSLLWAG